MHFSNTSLGGLSFEKKRTLRRCFMVWKNSWELCRISSFDSLVTAKVACPGLSLISAPCVATTRGEHPSRPLRRISRREVNRYSANVKVPICSANSTATVVDVGCSSQCCQAPLILSQSPAMMSSRPSTKMHAKKRASVGSVRQQEQWVCSRSQSRQRFCCSASFDQSCLLR